jgi:hypothetical protein
VSGSVNQLLTLAVMFFHKSPEKSTSSEKEMIETALFEILTKSKVKPKPSGSFNRKIQLTVDPIWILVRPLTFYAGIKVADCAGTFVFRMMGFKIDPIGRSGINIYHRPGNSMKPPIIIFHGLGIGVCTYVPFVLGMINSVGDRDIILFEIESLSMRLDDRHLLPKDFADYVAISLSFMIDRKCIFVGHSIGTACVRWMDLYHPELVQGRIFIEPISFALWNHDIAHNALYRWPSNAVSCF